MNLQALNPCKVFGFLFPPCLISGLRMEHSGTTRLHTPSCCPAFLFQRNAGWKRITRNPEKLVNGFVPKRLRWALLFLKRILSIPLTRPLINSCTKQYKLFASAVELKENSTQRELSVNYAFSWLAVSYGGIPESLGEGPVTELFHWHSFQLMLVNRRLLIFVTFSSGHVL